MWRILIGIVVVGILSLMFLQPKPMPVAPQHPSPSPTITRKPTPPAQSVDVSIDTITYRVAWALVRDLSSLTLIPNFTQKRTARSLIDSDECTYVVSGGFYTKDDQPTGLFSAQGKTIRTSIPNNLLNGFFSMDQNDTASILSSPPGESVRLALQTGPILFQNGMPVKLAIRDDEFARRVGLGVMKNGSVVFFIIYDPENTWSGPKLADMPNILSKILPHLTITDAVNLDGGSASAFIRDEFSLQELTSVGSFFCIR
ncbi:MAG: phosphodiester glycosidase family protein [Patescibacteria group bacterium]